MERTEQINKVFTDLVQQYPCPEKLESLKEIMYRPVTIRIKSKDSKDHSFISNDGNQVGFFVHNKREQICHWVIHPSKGQADTVQILSLHDRKYLGMAKDRFNVSGGEFRIADNKHGDWTLLSAQSGMHLKKTEDGGVTETADMVDYRIRWVKDKKEKREKKDRDQKDEPQEKATPKVEAKPEPKVEAKRDLINPDLNQKARVDCRR